MKIPPALVLFFLAPAIAELLSGSSPPAEFFNPIALFLLASLYGSGALIIRELKVRWNKGYVSVFILGAAYGIVEEGLMVKSFFDPNWMDLGVLGIYGRWIDVNWVWAEWLTIYHAIFSIAIPITLVELAYIEKRNESWIGNKTFAALLLLLGAVTALGYFALTPYRPPTPQYVLTIISVIVLTLIAWKIPPSIGKKGKIEPPSPSKLALTGFLFALSIFLLFMAGPYLIPEPPALMILGLLLIYVMARFLRKYKWSKETQYHKFSLVAGMLSFLIVLAPLQELDASRPDNPKGMTVVGIISLLMLLLLAKKLRENIK